MRVRVTLGLGLRLGLGLGSLLGIGLGLEGLGSRLVLGLGLVSEREGLGFEWQGRPSAASSMKIRLTSVATKMRWKMRSGSLMIASRKPVSSSLRSISTGSHQKNGGSYSDQMNLAAGGGAWIVRTTLVTPPCLIVPPPSQGEAVREVAS